MALGRILWILLVALVIVWLIGLVTNIAGDLIHLLLIVVAAILIYNLVTGRRSRVL